NGLDDEEVAGDTATADRPGAVLNGHVVIDEDRLEIDAFHLQHFRSHLERHAVAAVVVDDVEDALGGIQDFGRLHDVVHRRCGEYVARTGSIQHALANHHDVCWFVPGAGPLDN